MKTILRIYDFNISTGEVYSNQGFFNYADWEILRLKIKRRENNPRFSGDVKRITNGWILRNIEDWISL